MNLTEAECQVLACLRGAELDGQPGDRACLDKRGKGGNRLTEAGWPLGDAFHQSDNFNNHLILADKEG